MGFPTGISGGDLAWRGEIQAMRLGTRFVMPRSVVRVERLAAGNGVASAASNEGDPAPIPAPANRQEVAAVFRLHLNDGEHIDTKTLVIASGVQYRRLPAAGVDRFEGGGVYYAATDIEARFCANSPVAIVGGGNSAGQAAMFLSRSASHVHVLVRNDGLNQTMSPYLSSRLAADPKITVHPHTEVVALEGEQALETLVLHDPRNGETRKMPAAALFPMIGAAPNTQWLEGLIALNEKGFVPTGADIGAGSPYATSIPGVFAVGDVRLGSVKRVASAVGEGSVVISQVWNHVHGGIQP
jgi:thioredoxin reductase (NADPH)